MTQTPGPIDRFKEGLFLLGKTISTTLKDRWLALIVGIVPLFGLKSGCLVEDARSLANRTACALIYVVLASAAISYAIESPLFPEAQASVSDNALGLISLSDHPVIQSETLLGQGSDDGASYSFGEPNHHEPSIADGEGKNKRHSALTQERVHRWPHGAAVVSTFAGQTNLQHLAIWASTHGHQLQLYNSADKTDASLHKENGRKTFFRLPSRKRGGLFCALESQRRNLVSFSPQHSKSTKPAAAVVFGCPAIIAGIPDNHWRAQAAPQPGPTKTIRRWLFHQALLL